MADYTFEGKSLHVDLNLVDGTSFSESFAYLDKNLNPINLNGFTAKLRIYDVDSGVDIITGTHLDKVTLGGSSGQVTVQLSSQDIATLVKPCYKWSVHLNDSMRFLRGYIYRNNLL